MLFDSLVLRVMITSSGETRRNSASALRAFSFSGISRERLFGDGSASTLRDSRVSTSATGRDAGHRLAAFITDSSGGITNCSRTLFQNGSPAAGPAGRMSVAGPISRAHAGSAKSAAEPPTANSLANERRETAAEFVGISGLRPGVGGDRPGEWREYSSASGRRRRRQRLSCPAGRPARHPRRAAREGRAGAR